MIINQHVPQSEIVTFLLVFPDYDPTASNYLRIYNPSTGLPNTTCLPSNQEVGTNVRKNYDPFVLGPALAIERHGPSCLKGKPSSFKNINIYFIYSELFSVN